MTDIEKSRSNGHGVSSKAPTATTPTAAGSAAAASAGAANVSRYMTVLSNVPAKFTTPSLWRATKRLVFTLLFAAVSLHAIHMSPVWALPICWCLAAVAFTFIFEIGHACAVNHFLPLTILNHLVGTILLLPFLQPLGFWNGDHTKPSTWFRRAFGWGSIVTRFHLSHLIVPVVIGVVAPVVLARPDGLYDVAKFWLAPLVLFHVWMTSIYAQGQQLRAVVYPSQRDPAVPRKTQAGRDSPRGSMLASASHHFQSDVKLLSYLTFTVGVPSYHVWEAMTFVKRAWSKIPIEQARANVVSEYRAPETEPDYYETLAVAPLKVGFAKLPVIDFCVTIVLALMSLVWLNLLFSHHPGLSKQLMTSLLHPSMLTLKVPAWEDIAALWGTSVVSLNMAVVSCIFLAALVYRYFNKAKSVYLVEFATYSAPDHFRVDAEMFKKKQRIFPYSQDSLDFMDKLIHKTGIGNNTPFPPSITMNNPPQLTFTNARKEAQLVMFSVLDELFAATNTDPQDVDILVVNCSLFNPTPSLSAMIINKYKMREDIQSYNLSGMGCSASVIAVHLAKDLLQVYPNSNAVIVSTENITQNWYRGDEKGMLISNTLFRMGGAAMLLSNKSSDRSRAKYQLLHTIRTHRGADDEAYYAVYQDATRSKEGDSSADADSAALSIEEATKLFRESPDKKLTEKQCSTNAGECIGVRLSKNLMTVAGEALKHNITSLAPLILPWSEQVRYLYRLFRRRVLKIKEKPYVPNFKKAVQHFCIHAGGRAVIDAIQDALKLNEYDVEASKMTLHNCGNTSSSSIWYELEWLEQNGRIKRSDKIWQIAFGSGFKCNSAVWKSLSSHTLS